MRLQLLICVILFVVQFVALNVIAGVQRKHSRLAPPEPVYRVRTESLPTKPSQPFKNIVYSICNHNRK